LKKILGEAKTVRELLNNARYDVDYYQREYRWDTKQVQELLEDPAEKFLDESDEPEAVKSYGQYFLGSVVISRNRSWEIFACRAYHTLVDAKGKLLDSPFDVLWTIKDI
jgi:hypothetical protein